MPCVAGKANAAIFPQYPKSSANAIAGIFYKYSLFSKPPSQQPAPKPTPLSRPRTKSHCSLSRGDKRHEQNHRGNTKTRLITPQTRRWKAGKAPATGKARSATDHRNAFVSAKAPREVMVTLQPLLYSKEKELSVLTKTPRLVVQWGSIGAGAKPGSHPQR